MTTSTDTGVDAGSRCAMAVIGAGSWGTALAVHLARTIHRTVLWGLAPPDMADLARDRVNRRFLPEAAFPESLEIAPTLEAAVAAARVAMLRFTAGWPSNCPKGPFGDSNETSLM